MTRRRLTIIAVVLLLGTFATSAMAAGNATQWKTAPRVSAKTLIQSVDRRAPQVPPSLSVSAVSTTGISLTWGASRDNVGVAGYGVYLNGTRLTSTTARSYTLSGLKCGTTYKVGVDAFDATRNRSGIASVLAATAPCVDATAPTAPASLHQSGWSQTGLAVEWSESSDNVGVAGYSIYRNGVPIAVTQQRSTWVVGLVCGAGYSVSVDAYDAAGNHSPRATAVANTTACADTSPPGAPHNLRVSGSTESAISVAWDAPVDDVGVAEYRLSVNDVDMRTTTATTATFHRARMRPLLRRQGRRGRRCRKRLAECERDRADGRLSHERRQRRYAGPDHPVLACPPRRDLDKPYALLETVHRQRRRCRVRDLPRHCEGCRLQRDRIRPRRAHLWDVLHTLGRRGRRLGPAVGPRDDRHGDRTVSGHDTSLGSDGPRLAGPDRDERHALVAGLDGCGRCRRLPRLPRRRPCRIDRLHLVHGRGTDLREELYVQRRGVRRKRQPQCAPRHDRLHRGVLRHGRAERSNLLRQDWARRRRVSP